jgi:UPF0176 protein
MTVIATFYKFVFFAELGAVQAWLRSHCERLQLKGTILLATEGINGTVAGDRSAIDGLMTVLRSDQRLADLTARESLADAPPFERMKVRIRAEIVPLGAPEVSPVEQVGTYVAPQDWNQLITDPEVLLIDTRNDYEVAIGTFQGAENPQTQNFREFTHYAQQLHPQQHRKIAMFCTGGIRCEKATAYLLTQGFEEVYHLKGGILNYLETVEPEQSLWQGECFVFDQRVAVTHGMAIGSHQMCLACGHPITEDDQRSPLYEVGVSCPNCCDRLSDEQKAHYRERQRQRRLARQRSMTDATVQSEGIAR